MRTQIVIAIAVMSAAIGEAFLSYSMKRFGRMEVDEPSQWVLLVTQLIRNPYIFTGVVFLGIFFFLYLAALSWADLSYVQPLTALSYVFAAVLARFFLKEDISFFRWAGTLVIVIGIILVALDSRPGDGTAGAYHEGGAPRTTKASLKKTVP